MGGTSGRAPSTCVASPTKTSAPGGSRADRIAPDPHARHAHVVEGPARDCDRTGKVGRAVNRRVEDAERLGKCGMVKTRSETGIAVGAGPAPVKENVRLALCPCTSPGAISAPTRSGSRIRCRTPATRSATARWMRRSRLPCYGPDCVSRIVCAGVCDVKVLLACMAPNTSDVLSTVIDGPVASMR